ncbi:Kinetochore-associated protein DSN1 [Nakaseomyces bracarensis]|uniref:Kinetochore-associated protein DSN1 n=1 Tax=Nakaseomyces bracarensis TaxID=273131 RepID=A0ABR4NXI3_9SACH
MSRLHTVHMETIPLGGKESGSEDDFEFRRHSTKGVPTLGERLDSLHEVRGARRIDNFSSRGATRGSSADVEMEMEMDVDGEREADREVGETRNNTSMQVADSSVKYLVPLEYLGGLDIPRDKLIKVINTEASISASQNERARNKRLSLSQRGRRLSMLSGPDRKNTIVSPHKEVPEEEFYKHVGDVSFGKGLQVRQLFNWCSDRTYTRILESDRKRASNVKTGYDDNVYGDPKKITMDIIKCFVQDLKKGTVEIDWEAEEEEVIEEGLVDDSELRALFEDYEDDDTRGANVKRTLGYHDEEDFDVTLAIQPTRPELENRKKLHRSRGNNLRKRKIIAPQFRLPNSKNVENEKNLQMLKEKISRLEKEIDDWASTLDSYDAHEDWDRIRNVKTDPVPKDVSTGIEIEKVGTSLHERIYCLSSNAHLLDSTSRALLESLKLKIDKLSRVCYINDAIEKKSLDTRQLLQGLASTLNE